MKKEFKTLDVAEMAKVNGGERNLNTTKSNDSPPVANDYGDYGGEVDQDVDHFSAYRTSTLGLYDY